MNRMNAPHFLHGYFSDIYFLEISINSGEVSLRIFLN